MNNSLVCDLLSRCFREIDTLENDLMNTNNALFKIKSENIDFEQIAKDVETLLDQHSGKTTPVLPEHWDKTTTIYVKYLLEYLEEVNKLKNEFIYFYTSTTQNDFQKKAKPILEKLKNIQLSTSRVRTARSLSKKK